MQANLHHAHIFASDIDATVAWWRDGLGGEVVFDGSIGPLAPGTMGTDTTFRFSWSSMYINAGGPAISIMDIRPTFIRIAPGV